MGYKDEIDYTEDSEFWAGASANRLYEFLIKYPVKQKLVSEKAWDKMVKNLDK